MTTARSIIAFLTCLAAAMASARQPDHVVLLWPNGAPGAKGDKPTDKPDISVYLPDRARATGGGVVICPGGAYGFLAMDHEGVQVAEWLNSLGIAGCVLKYRHNANGYQHPHPLGDAQRAMRLVRANAKDWGIDPKRLGILGFSAGGHLASTVSTHFDSGNTAATDPIDRQSCRPDFAVLCYPVISLTQAFTHQGSKRNLLGANPDPKLVESLSSELQVTPQTPPTFLMHTGDDEGVPVENSLLYYQALRKSKVSAELHIYEHGRHGLGLAKNDPAVSSWPDRCADWLHLHRIIAPR